MRYNNKGVNMRKFTYQLTTWLPQPLSLTGSDRLPGRKPTPEIRSGPNRSSMERLPGTHRRRGYQARDVAVINTPVIQYDRPGISQPGDYC